MYKKSKELCLLYKNSEWRKRKLLIEDALYWGYLYYEQKNTALDFNDLIILINSFSREKKVIHKKEEIVKENKKDKKYELVYDYLENEVLNHNTEEEDISNEARRYIKKVEAEKERRFRRGRI